jgi:hypothetical protein
MEELTLALAKFFCDTWDSFIGGPSEDTQYLIERTPLVEEVIATQEDIDNGDTPEEIEEGEPYYALSALGEEAWNLVHKKPEENP